MRLFCVLWVACGLALGQEVVQLWPHGAPGSEGAKEEEVWVERGQHGVVDRSVANVHKPSLTVYLPLREKATGTGVVVCPGGAYRHLAIDKEGHDVAKWLASLGVAGFVLKYRLPQTKGHSYTVETALADAQEGVRLVRKRASEWGVEARRIGMMGFSAGGDLAARAGMSPDPSARPNFLVLVYPLIPAELNITKETPPAFLVHADDDRLTSEHSVRFYLGLKRAGVSAELHVYAQGGHGFGILNRGLPTSAWALRCEDWLRQSGLLGPRR
jgi:endo-1,4-beta-xylanase